MYILTHTKLIKVCVRTKGKTKKVNEYNICDKDLLKLSKKEVVVVTPYKLPMIVPAKDFIINEGGGYLLNNLDYNEYIFSYKNEYKIK